MQERLQKIISASGLMSRRAAEECIKVGRVSVNGVAAALGMSADTETDNILVDGRPLPTAGEKLYIMLNKPKGYVTTLHDEKDRRCVTELLSGLHARVYPVGRLDMYSEGLLICTNDGEFANRLMHPSHEVEKCYLTWVQGEDVGEAVEYLRYPMEIDGYMTRGAEVDIISLLPGGAFVTNLKNVLADANIPVLTGIRNSLIVSAFSAAFSVYFSALTAYGIYAYNFRFKKAAFAIILLIMTMPTQVSALGFLQLITKMGLKNSFIPLIVPSIAAPTVFFFMKQYLDASLPMEIVEAARIDGAGEFYTFWVIAMPMVKPAWLTLMIESFKNLWNSGNSIYIYSEQLKTFNYAINQIVTGGIARAGVGAAATVVMMVVPITVFVICQSNVIETMGSSGMKD